MKIIETIEKHTQIYIIFNDYGVVCRLQLNISQNVSIVNPFLSTTTQTFFQHFDNNEN